MILRSSASRRSGATTVEVAVVLSVFLLFLFGIFEYCRYLMMLHITTNAARDGARYAVVNVNKGSTFDVTDYNDGVNTYPSIRKYTNDKASSVSQMITGYTVATFACDMTQLNQTVPVVAPKPGAWNQAQFGERIAVRISGTYSPVLPSFLYMGAAIPVNVVATMGSEG
jgi:Flp pilus assembly protein TadG